MEEIQVSTYSTYTHTHVYIYIYICKLTHMFPGDYIVGGLPSIHIRPPSRLPG